MGWRDILSSGLVRVANTLRTESISAAVPAREPIQQKQVESYRTAAHRETDPKGPREREYSAQRPISRNEWEVGDDIVALGLAEQGQLQLAVQLCEAMLADGVVSGLLDTRSSGLLKLPVKVTGDEELVAELTGVTKTNQDTKSGLLWRMFPQSTLARIIQFGIMLGAGIGYFVQGPDDPCPVLHVIEHQFLVHRRDSDGHYHLYYRTAAEEVEIIPGDGRWFVFAPYGLQRFWVYGKWRAVGRFWLLKNASVEQRETWGNRLARGIQWVVAPSSSNEDERNAITEFLSSVITPPVITMLQGWEMKVHDVQGRGFEVWKDGKDDSNDEIRMALSGQLVTSGGRSLGFGSGNIFADIAQTLIDSNAESLAESVHHHGLEPWADRRGLCGPWVEWDTVPPQDKLALAEALDSAGKALSSVAKGLTDIGSADKLNVKAFFSKAGIELEDDVANDDGEVRTVSGIKVRIEYPEGSLREGIGANGVPWQTLMSGASYGEIPGTEGADGEALDAYVGPFGDAREAYILEQLDFYGRFDEYKIFLGFFSLNHAQETFRRLSNPDNEGRWSVVPAELIAGLVRDNRSKLAPVPVEVEEPENDKPIEVAADADETPDVITDESASELAEQMTQLGIDRCEHGRVNECPKCGIERVRGVIVDDAGNFAGWKIAWRAITRIAAEAPKKYAHIDFTPPKGAREEAQLGLEWRKEFGRGGTEVGVARARDISNGKSLSPETVRRMKAFFDRHENGASKGSKPGEDGYPSAWVIAWKLWGGDAGYAWAKKVVRQMEAADE